MKSGASITGTKEVVVRLQRIRGRAEHPRRVWSAVGRLVSREVRKQFATEGANFGTPWKPLKPEYRAWKSREYPGRGILVASGSLRSGFTSRPMDIERISDKEGVYGSSSPLAVFHQFGTHSHQTGEQILPPRPILRVTRKLSKSVAETIARYIMDGRLEGP